MIQQIEICLPSYSRGFHPITHIIKKNLPKLPSKGILNIFIKHTSAGLTINENADPTVLDDFETVFNKLIPENSKIYTHAFEGNDDMPAHIKTALTDTCLNIPISNNKLNLGTWQGIYLCEFRNKGGSRKIVLTILS